MMRNDGTNRPYRSEGKAETACGGAHIIVKARQKPPVAVKVTRALAVFLMLMLSVSLHAQNAGKKPSVALVLSGGGAKGYALLPIIEAIDQMGIPLDMIVGVSIGSIIGGLYSAGYSTLEIKDNLSAQDWSHIFQDSPHNLIQDTNNTQSYPINVRFHGLTPSIPTGYSRGVHVYELLKNLTAKIPSYYDFDKLQIPFRAAAVDALSGTLKVFDSGDIAEVIRASMSLPGIFQPSFIDGQYYIDGGVKNNLPIGVAKSMGYDIIIAIDIGAILPKNIQEHIPANVLYLNRTDEQGANNNSSVSVLARMARTNFLTPEMPDYSIADLVIIPDVHDFSILDFTKSDEIYTKAKDDMAAYLEALKPIKAKIDARIAVDTKKSYNELPAIVIDDVRIEGVLPFDRPYIEGLFNTKIKGKELSPLNLDDLINAIYYTGNYDHIVTRVDTRTDDAILEVIVHVTTSGIRNTLVSLGMIYQGTASSGTLNNLSLLARVNFNGLTGPGSQLSIGGSVLSSLGADIRYLQPLTPRLYVLGSANASRTQISAIITDDPVNGEYSVTTKLEDYGGKIDFGIWFDAHNMLRLSAGYDYTMLSVTDTGLLKPFSEYRSQILSFGIEYKLSTLDTAIFARRGVFLDIKNTVYYPFTYNARYDNVDDNQVRFAPDMVYNMLTIDSSFAFRVNKYFSIIANIFVGSDLTPHPDINEGLFFQYFFGFNETDRMYFPQIASSIIYFYQKAAGSFIIQYKPWDNITILGGQVVMSASASLGAAKNNISEFVTSFDYYYWNTSINLGLRLTSTMGLLLRGGIGSTPESKFTPFVAFDLGYFRY
jgi:NTE family protein